MAGTNGAATKDVVKLSKAIATHGGNTAEIKFAPFTAELMIRYGRLPFKLVRNEAGVVVDVETDFALAAKYIADLTGVDEVLLGQLSSTDFGALVIYLRDVALAQGN